MKYPILYKSNETDFFAMGLGPIQMLKATVTQERNGIFVFEGEILTDNPLFPLVLENCIIKADADHLLKDQRFRIKRIVPNHDGKAQIYAEHVSYLSRELTIKPEVNITGSAQIALSQWKASIVESNPFVVSSDITTSASTKWRIDKVSNPMMALGGVEGSILDRWGGEYLFDNYHISLLKKRGKTATNILAYGRNITDFEQERNILSTYTSIAPYAIYTDDREREVIVTVDGFVVDSEHINKYPNRVTKPIDFSSEFGSDEIPTKARLTTLAQQYIKDNEIGVPTTSIKISFLDLSQTADYADYAFLEQVNLCDDVRVHYPKLGVNTIAKVVRVVWNCLTESYDEIEIGQKRMSLASQIQEQNKVIQEINTQTNQAQVSADGKNMIFYGLYGANGLGQPTATKIGDTWFKPSGTETEMLIWTGVVWTNPFLGGDNIADEAITGTKIANATIGSAKIINVDANKITANSLSSISANIGDITAGTLSGPNIHMNLNNGEVIFRRGTIESDGFKLDMTPGNQSIYLKSKNANWNVDANTVLDYKGITFRDPTKALYQTEVGLNAIKYARSDVTGSLAEIAWDQTPTSAYGLITLTTRERVGNNMTTFNSVRLHTNGIELSTHQHINMGALNGDFNMTVENGSSNWSTLKGNFNLYARGFIFTQPGYPNILLELGSDATGQYLKSDAVLNRALSSTHDVGIDQWGVIHRKISARKYKKDIQRESLLNAKKVLEISPSSWIDKQGNGQRHYGFIADEFDEIGLKEVVQYGVDGQVEGLSYDRISMYLLELLKDHEKEISALKTTINFDIWQLKNEIKELKNEINSLRKVVV